LQEIVFCACSFGAIATELEASNTPTATKLSQNPACHNAQGSATTITASASSHTQAQGQRTPSH
jgi:hypothetical protein